MLRTSFQLLTILSLAVSSAGIAAEKTDASKKDIKAKQLRMQARIAAEQGDFSTAVQSILDASLLTGDRVTANQARQVMPTPQAGGGSPFANFDEIIQLIQAQTAPPARWVDIDGEGGQISISSQGVFVASPAVLKAMSKIKDDSHLLKAAEFARNANHNRDVRKTSALRMVSLPRLEKHVGKLLQDGKSIPEDVATIAGLSQIDFLIVYPDSGELVIAGPASDWNRTADGKTLSAVNGRPTLNLDDLVTLTRTFGQNGPGFFMCTIDPKQSQVAAVQEYVNQNRRTLNARTAANFTKTLEQKLGLQNVFVRGIPQDSRVASVIVDADYRMKEIGIGRRKGPTGMKSYFDLLTRSEQRGSGSMDALRWWMAVGYDGINVSSDGNVFEFFGNPVQCLSEDQIVGAGGQRTATGKSNRANAKFAELFTKHLPELANADPVFADLENIFDLAMVAALVHSRGLADQVGWTSTAFAQRGSYRIKGNEVPTELMTAAHHRVYKGGSVVIQVAGGVRADLSVLLNDRSRMKANPKLDAQAPKATPLGQQNGNWWWDATPTSK